MRTTLLTFTTAVLLGCGGGSTAPPPASDSSGATPDNTAALVEAQRFAEQQGGVTRGGGAKPAEFGDQAPTFSRVSLEPSEVRVSDDIQAVADLAPGHSPYIDQSFTWIVNDREVRGITRQTLPAARGAFKKGDRVRVRAQARDEKGREAILESGDLVVGNSTPTILTDLRDARRMNGVQLVAEDADGDELTWELKAGPPGVSIHERGRITVRRVNLEQEWKGEVVFAVSDPEGAASELHIPVAINAAEADRVEERRETNRVSLEQMDRKKLDAAALQDAADVSKMNDEEFKKYMDEREARGGPQ